MERTRPGWVEYFLGLARVVSKRSHDEETQHGCVIADRKNRIISVGYNGFPRGMKDAELPARRPAKYDWMLHSERNAVANCIIRPDGAIAYVTGEPCNDCLMYLWQHGIEKVFYIDQHGSHLINEKTRSIREEFLKHTGMEVIAVQPDLKWLGEVSTGC